MFSQRIVRRLGPAFVLLIAAAARAEDWPNFRGPRHDGVSREADVLTDWPAAGPTQLWSRDVGPGFSSFAVAGDRLYTCGTEDKLQVLFCLKASTGDVIWKRTLEPEITDPDPHLHGPRATPTIDGDRVYVQGTAGLLVALDVGSGEILWQHDYVEEYDASA
ncbi:MAG: PQQ-binding-like beta-propeller repeat protein, partial [Phycisphaerae bacterium]